MCIPSHRHLVSSANTCDMHVHCGQEPTNVTIATYIYTQLLTLQPGEVRKISFGKEMFPSAGAESKAVRLMSNAEIQVLIYKDSYNDPVHPSNQYNGVYQVPSDRASGMLFFTIASDKQTCSLESAGNHFYLVSTFYDNTLIEVTYQNGLSFEVTLPAYGTFTEATFNYLDMLAGGTQISSNASINVVSGNLCESFGGSSGSLISSIPPVANLANNYMVPHLIGSTALSPGFYLAVVAVEHDTVVEFDGETTTLPTAGSSVTFDRSNAREWMFVNCSNDCLAVQFSMVEPQIFGRFMMSLLPSQNFYTWVFFTTLNISSLSYISLVVEGEAPGSGILLNGVPLGGLYWSTFQGYATTERAISQGTYILESESGRPFAAYVYTHTMIATGGAGYALLPLSNDVNITTTATAIPTSTPPPAEDPPQISVRLNGTVYTEDGQDIAFSCAQVKHYLHENKFTYVEDGIQYIQCITHFGLIIFTQKLIHQPITQQKW